MKANSSGHTRFIFILLAAILLIALSGIQPAGAIQSLSVASLPNDDVSTPEVILEHPYTNTIADTSIATSDVGDPDIAACNLNKGRATVWYQYTPTADQSLYIDTFGSDYDTFLAVWTGTPGSLTPVACNDDAEGKTQSKLHVDLTNGTTYYIEVGQYYGLLSGSPTKALPASVGGSLRFSTTTFGDVAGNYLFYPYIEAFYNQGITGGCSLNPLHYCPGNSVTRAQMAVFILKAIYGPSYTPPPATGVFTDVPDNFFRPWIEAFYNEGITGGCSLDPLMFCPNNSVTRAQMALFLLKGLYGPSYTPPPATGVFTDVPDNFFRPWIEAFYNEGITGGCSLSPLMFCPNNSVTRGQMAVFIDKGFDFAPVPLPSPSALTATATSETNVDLSWAYTGSGETGFEIERSDDGMTGWALIGSVPAGTTTYSDTSAVCNTAYYYRVRSYRSGDGAYSSYTNVAGDTTFACSIPAPSSLTAVTQSDTEIELNWTDNSSDETEFRIERSPNGASGWAQIDVVGPNVTTYADTTLTCNITYYYRVKSYNSGNGALSSASNVASDKTSGCADRHGGWVDTINMFVANGATAVADIVAGNMDIYGSSLSTPQDFEDIATAGLESSLQTGLYYELTINPVGPIFSGTGKLNPFASAEIREALNWLIDRQYLNTQVYGGNSFPKWVSVIHDFPDYTRNSTAIQGYEAYYAYDPTLAASVITTEMQALGATKVGDLWMYNGEPVEIIFLIRTDSDGTRLPMGNIIADWLEDLGFSVTRQYGTSSELSALWVGGNPDDGEWHLYTGAWGASGISRDDGGDFQWFYSPNSSYGFTALWQSYYLEPAEQEVFDDLAYHSYSTLAERTSLFEQALAIQFKYNYRVWLIDGTAATPWIPELDVSYNLARGVDINTMWPFTLRYDAAEGGVVDWGEPDLLVDSANPVAGSNWTYDAVWQLPTQDYDAIPHPQTGLQMNQRVDLAEVTVFQYLPPVLTTESWVTLNTASSIAVPGNAWVDWDPVNQVFITADEKFPGGQNAFTKVVFHYPDSLWNITWQDGSHLTPADFVMEMIMWFEPGKVGSSIYDSSQESNLDYFLSNFKGIRIVSEYPLVVEYYSDTWYFDAEQIAIPVQSRLWPQAGWHVYAVSNKAEAAGLLAYSWMKADSLGVEWTNYVGGPSLSILSSKLTEAIGQTHIPYINTLGDYITSAEAASRYTNLEAFYLDHGHFWVGTGPYILDSVDLNTKNITLIQNPNYIDPSNKWSAFNTP